MREFPDNRKVTIKSFYLCKDPVTQRQWIFVMGSNPSEFKGYDRPVEKVSWGGVQIFIGELNKIENTKNTAYLQKLNGNTPVELIQKQNFF